MRKFFDRKRDSMPKLLRAVPTLSPGGEDGWRKGEKVKNGWRESLRKGHKKRDWKKMIRRKMSRKQL